MVDIVTFSQENSEVPLALSTFLEFFVVSNSPTESLLLQRQVDR